MNTIKSRLKKKSAAEVPEEAKKALQYFLKDLDGKSKEVVSTYKQVLAAYNDILDGQNFEEYFTCYDAAKETDNFSIPVAYQHLGNGKYSPGDEAIDNLSFLIEVTADLLSNLKQFKKDWKEITNDLEDSAYGPYIS